MGARRRGDTPERLRAKVIRARLDLEDLLGCGLVEYDPVKDRYLLHNLERVFAAGLEDLTADEARAARLAHARYYLAALQKANDLYLQGSQRALDGLALFDREAREVRAAWAALTNQAIWVDATIPAGMETHPTPDVGRHSIAADPALHSIAAGSNAATPEDLELIARYPASFANLMAVRLLPEERMQWLAAGRKANRLLGDQELEVVLASSLGMAYYVMDRYAESQVCLEEALQPALAQARSVEAVDDPQRRCVGLVRVLGNLGALFRIKPKTRLRALRYLGKQLDLARRFSLPREEGRALGTLGRVYLDLGDKAKAIEYYQAELAITDVTGDRRARAIALGGLADAYRVLKDFDRAVACFEEDIAISREMGDRRGQAIASWMLGKVYNDMGNLPKAVEWMQVLVDYEREIGHQDARWHAEKVADLQARMRGE